MERRKYKKLLQKLLKYLHGCGKVIPQNKVDKNMTIIFVVVSCKLISIVINLSCC
jgi:hypothetical protein